MLYRNNKGIISLYNGIENILDIENDATAVVFEDGYEYGPKSKCFFLKNQENQTVIMKTSITEDFVSLAYDENSQKYVHYIGIQFGVVMLIAEPGRYILKQKPSKIQDIGNFGNYTQLFKRPMVQFDIGFSYVEQTRTAYVFAKNLVYQWGASSSDTLIENANLFSYNDIMDLNTETRQILTVGPGNPCLENILKVDVDYPGVMYITSNGIYS